MSAEKRRSERLMLTVPLRIQWTDSAGATHKEDARTITLNRHGARIQTSRPLSSGQVVRLVNLVSRREADFRVVGPTSPRTEKGSEYGVECLNSKENIWGIQFPPSESGDSADSSALLECRKCHTVALKKLSLVEVEVLGTVGILPKPCETCAADTPWGHAEKQVAMEGPPGEAAMLGDAGITKGAPQRKHRRVSLQLPVLVRDFYGGVEITKSENVSKGGFCFASEKNLHVGEGIMVACPYSTSGQSIEVPGRIVRRREVEGTNRKIYGVRYEQQTN